MTKNFYKFLNEVFSAKAQREDNKEQGSLLNTSMSREGLSALGAFLKSEVLEVILRIMARSIENRSAYSNDMLHIAFDYEVNRKGRLPTETLLFGIIKKTILEILKDTTNKKDWYWMYVDTLSIHLPLVLSLWFHISLSHPPTISSGKTTFCSRVSGMRRAIPMTSNRAFYGTNCSNGSMLRLVYSQQSSGRP